jgi:hypothetical protein
MTKPRRQFAAGTTNYFFFEREAFDYAVGAVAGKLQQGVAADATWLPELISIGGFQYERGRLEFTEWSESIKALVGNGVEPLLQRAWEALPLSVAERFGATINSNRADLEMWRIGRAYKQLQISFRQSRGSSIIEVMSNLAKLEEEDSPPAEQQAGDSEGTHQHSCAACGMPYGHEPWQCEPPDDQYCPMCAESVAGPMPIWIERWTADSETEPQVSQPAEPKPATATAAGAAADATIPSTASGAAATVVNTMADTETAAAAQKAPAPAAEGAKEASAEAAPGSTPATKSVDNGIANPTKHGLAKVGGMDALKAMLYEDVVTAMRDPEDLKAYGLTIPNGILLFGPPGCGKTFISRALAEEMDFYFAEVFPSEIGSTFIHGTTLKIRELFDTAADQAPSIIFVDEFEGMVPARRELAAHQHQTAEEVSEFLKQLETCAERQILLIAATNEPWKIDPAVQRTGRLDKRIYVGPPDAAARAAILRFHLYGRRVNGLDVDSLAKSLNGYSAADLKVLVDEAARLARKARVPIGEDELRKAARERVPPSITAEDELRFETFEQRGTGTGPRRASSLLLPENAPARTAKRATPAEILADLLRRKS